MTSECALVWITCVTLSVMLLVLAVADGSSDLFGILGCPNSEVCQTGNPVANTLYDARNDTNGCGTAGMNVHMDSAYSDEITACCNAHDVCYGTCNERKESCDSAFAACMAAVCDNKTGLAQDACKETRAAFSGSVELFGCAPFLKSQRTACTCV